MTRHFTIPPFHRVPAPERIAFDDVHAVTGGDPLYADNARAYLRPGASVEEIRAAYDFAADEYERAEYRAQWRCPR